MNRTYIDYDPIMDTKTIVNIKPSSSTVNMLSLLRQS